MNPKVCKETGSKKNMVLKTEDISIRNIKEIRKIEDRQFEIICGELEVHHNPNNIQRQREILA